MLNIVIFGAPGSGKGTPVSYTHLVLEFRVLCGELIIIYLINTAQSMTAIAIRTPMIISVPQTK